MKTVLTVAGSDPTGGAGLQADLKVFRSFGVHGLSVPSALTVQSTEGIDYLSAIEGMLIKRQLDFLLDDIKPDAMKTGMLYTAHAVEVVADAVKRHSLSNPALSNLVVDPVTVSSSGTSLAGEGTLDAMRSNLFPLARVVTPNVYEAAVFTGMGVETDEDMEAAARLLRDMGPEAVIITGGHLKELAVDLFYDGADFHRLEAEKIEGEYHGTGCAFSAAVAVLLGLGQTPLEAARMAKKFVQNAIRRSYHPGKGMGLLNL